MAKKQEEGKLDLTDKRNETDQLAANKTAPTEDKTKSSKPEKKEKIKKISEADFKKAEDCLKKELQKRKQSKYRKNAEDIWKNVDRQVALLPMEVDDVDAEEEWLNVFDTGDLAKASENLTGDLLRTIFPDARNWFDPHIKPPTNLDEKTGENIPLGKKMQDMLDGRLRAFMTQQHADFGLRDRVELSLKEALHHGMFVAEVGEETLEMIVGDRIKEITSPVWIPHSMWNCYPDPSPSMMGDSMFYRGSMFIRSYMPRNVFMEMASGAGWIEKGVKSVPKRENTLKEDTTEDIEIDTYWGTVRIPVSGDGMHPSDSDMYFPNHKAILANGKMVYLDANKTPYPPIVVKGYERMDVRDIYAFSPIIKQSPMQDITSIMANEFVNGVQLAARPPLTYDANDPEFIANGGPRISPGAKTASKGSSNFNQLKIGDPSVALKGVEFGTASMKEALGRPGVQVGNRASATEVNTKQADSESGPFAFAVKVDMALRSFLHIQHYLNSVRKNFKYSYYCQEMDSPDWLEVTGKDLPEEVHFEIVGTKGLLGMAKRQVAFTQVNSFLLGRPELAPKLDTEEIVKQMYLDAGVKNPERFFKQPNAGALPPEVQQQMQQATELINQLKAENAALTSEHDIKEKKIDLSHQERMTKLNSQHETEVSALTIKAAAAQTAHEVALGDQKHALRTAELERRIREFEHSVALTVSKHTKNESAGKVAPGAMGLNTKDLPLVDHRGHELHRDAAGSHAYVGPNGEITPVGHPHVNSKGHVLHRNTKGDHAYISSTGEVTPINEGEQS